jgi:hypothetical protein
MFFSKLSFELQKSETLDNPAAATMYTRSGTQTSSKSKGKPPGGASSGN